MAKIFTEKQHSSIARELAKAAGITPEQAKKVLDVMHVGKLEENLVAHRAIMSDRVAVNALNLSQTDAKRRLGLARGEMLSLKNLRMGFKSKDLAGIMV
jgi:alkylated DNA nucleotide flippase Atl1